MKCESAHPYQGIDGTERTLRFAHHGWPIEADRQTGPVMMQRIIGYIGQTGTYYTTEAEARAGEGGGDRPVYCDEET